MIGFWQDMMNVTIEDGVIQFFMASESAMTRHSNLMTIEELKKTVEIEY